MKYLIAGVAVAVIIIAGGAFAVKEFISGGSKSGAKPTPTLGFAQQLSADKHPRPKLSFSSDGHYVTVDVTNIHSDQLEYNLIYEASVKKTRIQTGVNAAAKLNGKNTYSYRQLLGSESSGKFTNHADIQNAVMELTLRDSAGRSVFSATYPFTVSPGSSTDLKPQ